MTDANPNMNATDPTFTTDPTGTGNPQVPPIPGQDPLAPVDADGKPDPVKMEELVEKAVNERLAPIKSSLDAAYAERDAVRNELAATKQQAHEAQLAALKEEGKETEALKLQLTDLQGKYEALVSKNTELARTQLLSDSLEGVDFKNEQAKKLALSEINKDLVQDESGNWVHKSGISVKEYVELFVQNDEYSFLLAQKTSSGPGTSPEGIPPQAPRGGAVNPNAAHMVKPISELTTEEALRAAQDGRFGQPESRMAPF